MEGEELAKGRQQVGHGPEEVLLHLSKETTRTT